MNIPEPFTSIIRGKYQETDFNKKDGMETFVNNCFADLIEKLGLKDYQARAAKTGKMFEYIFWFIMKEL